MRETLRSRALGDEEVVERAFFKIGEAGGVGGPKIADADATGEVKLRGELPRVEAESQGPEKLASQEACVAIVERWNGWMEEVDMLCQWQNVGQWVLSSER